MNYFTDKNGTRIPAPGNPDDKIIPLPDGDISKQLKHISASLEAEVKLAKEQAEAAKEDAGKASRKAFWASLRSWISIAIAAFSVGVAFLTNLEKVGLGWQSLLQWLSTVLHLG